MGDDSSSNFFGVENYLMVAGDSGRDGGRGHSCGHNFGEGIDAKIRVNVIMLIVVETIMHQIGAGTSSIILTGTSSITLSGLRLIQILSLPLLILMCRFPR